MIDLIHVYWGHFLFGVFMYIAETKYSQSGGGGGNKFFKKFTYKCVLCVTELKNWAKYTVLWPG
jgi:hypothetical protein